MTKRKPTVEGGAAVPIALAKSDLGMKNTVVPVGSGTEIYYKKGMGQLVVRREGRTGGLNEKAKALKKCGGKRGSDFTSCVASALGRAPSAMID